MTKDNSDDKFKKSHELARALANILGDFLEKNIEKEEIGEEEMVEMQQMFLYALATLTSVVYHICNEGIENLDTWIEIFSIAVKKRIKMDEKTLFKNEENLCKQR